MLGIPNVRSCCGCYSVELGAKIIAWIQLITAVLLFSLTFEDHIEVLSLSGHIDTGVFYTQVTIRVAICCYPIVQGTLLMVGMKKKKVGILLAWLIIAFIFEMFLTAFLTAVQVIWYTIIYEKNHGFILMIITGIQIGISFFFITIVSTCRKNMLRNNALYDFGVLYTPEVVEVLTPNQPTGLIPTNPQIDNTALDTPEDKQENVVLT